MNGRGQPCKAAPLREEAYCRMHHPDFAKEVQEARRLGGQRTRKEILIEGAYGFEGIDSLEGIARLAHIAVVEALAGDPQALARSRALTGAGTLALKVYETTTLATLLQRAEQSTSAA